MASASSSCSVSSEKSFISAPVVRRGRANLGRLVALSSCSLVPRSVRVESGTDAFEQVALAERLRQITLHAGPQSACPRCLVGIGPYSDGGDGVAPNNQFIIELRPGYFRHLHIRDQASRAAAPLR